MSRFQATRKRDSKTDEVKSGTNKFYDVTVHPTYLIAIVAMYLVATANIGFFKQVLLVYPFASNIAFLISLTGLLFGLLWLVLQLLCYRMTIKPVLIVMVVVAAICGYFTDAYGTIFDRNMLVNTLQTDQAEAMDLMTPSFAIRLLLLGLLPAFLIGKGRLKRLTWRQAVLQKLVTLGLSIALILLCLFPFGDQYASFFRQHKQVRSYSNPLTPVYSFVKLGTDYIAELRRPDTLIPHATDAKRVVIGPATVKPKLMVLVVGETVRADHIGLNGYTRNTTPLLAKQSDVYSFKDATSCGTSTAYSVPCMFSYANRSDYDVDTAKYNENVLDTLNKQGINVVWRDNNSSSKGVADRVKFEDYKTPKTNPDCDIECRDIGMLKGFDKAINNTPVAAQPTATTSDRPTGKKDMLLVLHQMGNHGPAYYKRYPKAFEAYKPVCMSNELSKCDPSSVTNGYDNAIRYTDYFLNTVIETLKPYERDYDVLMVYISDHGESLGENNIYLHGLPYNIAPKAQKNVPVIVWSPKGNNVDAASLARMSHEPVSHDFITPSLLRFFNVTTKEVASEPTFFDMIQ